MNLSVVIPVYNVQPDYFRECLSSVAAAVSNSRAASVQVAVVDDASAELRSQRYQQANFRDSPKPDHGTLLGRNSCVMLRQKVIPDKFDFPLSL